jgi:hypothetical protein
MLAGCGGKLVSEKHGLSRREMLSLLAKGALTYPLSASVLRALAGGPQSGQAVPADWQLTSEELLEEIVSRGFLFFWNEANKHTGLVRDRALADGGPDKRRISSIAATGFGLSALCIGHQRQYLRRHQIGNRVVATLSFLLNHVEHVNGIFYHFIDWETGRRVRMSEVSPIDTAILLCGVLTARAYFRDPVISRLAANIYARVNWHWMLNGGKTFAMGWTPEYKFIGARWDTYCELMMMYLLAIAAPIYNVSPTSWDAIARPAQQYEGYSYIGGTDPLFVHQYAHAWFDFRNQRDAYANYFQNSAMATYVHKLFCLGLRWRYPDYEENSWGITASDSRLGYQIWGGPPEIGYPDGTLVPCAAGGSIPFLPQETIACLTNLYNQHGLVAWKRYGFVDAFNPLSGWTDVDVVGINLGITMLMAENYRTGFIWEHFMKTPEARRAMKLVGFRPTEGAKGK